MTPHHSTPCGWTSCPAHSLIPSLPWHIPGLDLILGELVRTLGHRVDGQEFFRRLSVAVHAANARSQDSCEFVFESLLVIVAPDPAAPSCWQIFWGSDQGPRPFDMRVRRVAYQLTKAQFDAQIAAIRSLAVIEGVTPSAFISLPHIFRTNASRFAAWLRSPVTGAILDWSSTLDCVINKANASLAHGAEQPYCFLSPPGGQAPCAQIAVPIHGLGAGWSHGLYLAIRVGENPETHHAGVIAPTIITPAMLSRNSAVLRHLRWLWSIIDNRVAA